MTETKTTGGRILGVRINWRIALAISIPLTIALVGAAVSGCDLKLGVSGIALTCEDK